MNISSTRLPRKISGMVHPAILRQAGWLLCCWIAVFLVLIQPVAAQDAEATEEKSETEPQFDRARAQGVIDELRKITSDNGVEELRQVRLGGVDQWISVRGRDRNNPILLFIHGGPSVPEMPASWFYQSAWEDYFTVVQWDQRGAGKSLAGADLDGLPGQLTIDRFACDAAQLVAHLRATYGKQKIFVMGHSWGTIVGLEVARRHPDWLHAYIGMGQAIDFMENERLGTQFALQAAQDQGHDQALAELQAILPYPEPGKPLDVPKILVQRKWLTHFGGLVWNRQDFTFQEDAALLSPDYAPDDITNARNLAGITVMSVLPEVVGHSFKDLHRIDTPVFIFAGEHDYATSTQLAVQWFDALQAPQKRLFLIPGVAHEIQFEAPGKLLHNLVSHVRPVAVAAGDGAPAE